MVYVMLCGSKQLSMVNHEPLKMVDYVMSCGSKQLSMGNHEPLNIW